VAKAKIATFFVKEKAGGRLDPNVREDQLADFCLATIQGAMLMGKSNAAVNSLKASRTRRWRTE
jgi:hypothetical protein